MDSLLKLLSSELRNIADKLDGGNSNVSEELLIEALELLSENDGSRIYSKELACNYLHLSRSRFDDFVRLDIIPKGQKHLGLKELTWKKLELDLAKLKLDELNAN